MGQDVRAGLKYAVRGGAAPVSDATGPDRQLRRLSGDHEMVDVPIRDGRAAAVAPSLDSEGFVLVRHDTKIADFRAPGIREAYEREIEALVQRVTGASRVVAFDFTLRTGDKDDRQAHRLGGPVHVIHNDYTELSGPRRLREKLPDEADRLLDHRFAVVQVWRPTAHPVVASPLALCDAGSIVPGDLVRVPRVYDDREGEIYHLHHDPAHRWFWFPRMTREEAVVFKCYDSATDGRARFPFHSAFDDPAAPADAPPRQSIDVRTFAFFADEPFAGRPGAPLSSPSAQKGRSK